MKTKRCSKCNEIKNIKEFYKNKNKKDGLSYWCKKCIKEWREKNSEKVKEYYKKWAKNNPEKIKEKYKRRKENNPEYQREYQREYYQLNKKRIIKTNSKWRKNNPEKTKGYLKKSYKKRHLIPKNRLNRAISSAIYQSLIGNKKGNHWENLVGYTLQDLIIHLEKQFKDGMNWNNYGKWHLDHIQPVSSFSFISYNDSEFKQCWVLSNLQPLWASENRSKGQNIKIITINK